MAITATVFLNPAVRAVAGLPKTGNTLHVTAIHSCLTATTLAAIGTKTDQRNAAYMALKLWRPAALAAVAPMRPIPTMTQLMENFFLG